MKRKLLSLLMALVAVCGVMPVKAAQTPTAGETYYLYNPHTKKFLNRGADNNVRAIVDNYGWPVELEQENEVYAFKFADNQYLGGTWWLYTDKNSSAKNTFKLYAQGEGVYYIETQELGAEQYLYVYLQEGRDKYAVAGNSKDQGFGNDDQYCWQFLSKDEHDAIVKNNEPKELLNNSIVGWEKTTKNGGLAFNTWSGEGNSDGSGMTTPFLQTHVNSGTALTGGTAEGKMSYTMKGLNPGDVYEVSALVRVFNETGTGVTGASFYCGGSEVSIDDYGKKCAGEYENKGKYGTFKTFGAVDGDGNLEFGVKLANDSPINWIAIKNVTFINLGKTEIDDATNELINGKDIANITSILTNNSFEDDKNGWTETATNSRPNNDNFSKKEGTYYTERWVESKNNLSDATLRHDVIVVPRGIYKVSVNAQNVVQSKSNEIGGSGYYLCANNAKTEVGSAGTYSVLIELTEDVNPLSIEMRHESCTGNWSACDNFTLTYYKEWPEVVGAKGKMNVDIETAQTDALDTYNANKNATNYAALQTAIDNANRSINAYKWAKMVLDAMEPVLQNTNVYTAEAYKEFYTDVIDGYGDGTLEDDAANALSVADRNNGNLSKILQSSWKVGGQDAIVNEQLYINSWSKEGDTDGSGMTAPFFESWVKDGEALGAATFSATIAGLEKNATCTISVLARVRQTNDKTKIANGITMQVGSGTPVDISAGQQIKDTPFFYGNFIAVGQTDENGNLKITINVNENSNISWLSFKNVKAGRIGYLATTLNSETVFLSRGLNWGTRAVADKYGLPVKIETNGNGETTIQFMDNNLYLFQTENTGVNNSIYTDNSVRNKWTFEQYDGGYAIKANNGIDGASAYLQVANDGTLNATSAKKVKWSLVDADTRNAQIAAYPVTQKANVLATAGIDVSELNEEYCAFTVVYEEAATAETFNQRVGNVVAEYNAYNKQIPGLTPGLYKVSMNAFHRTIGHTEDAENLYKAGYHEATAYMYANDEKVRVADIFAKTGATEKLDNEDRAIDKDGTYYIPSDKDGGETYLNAGYYGNELYVNVGNDGILNIGINIPSYILNYWLMRNGVKVEQVVRKTNVTLTMTSAGWATLILPFEATKPAELTLYSEVAENGDYLTLTEAGNVIEANTPYIVKSNVEVDKDKEYNFSGISTATETSYKVGYLTGVFADTPITSGYVLQDGTDGVGFYAVDAKVPITVTPYRVYVNFSAGVNTRFLLPGDETAVDATAAEDAIVDVYHIGGTLVKSGVKAADALNGLPKGIYVVGGKKVMK